MHKTQFPNRGKKKSPIHQAQLKQGETDRWWQPWGELRGRGTPPPPKQLLKALLPQQPHSLKRVATMRNPLPLLSPLRPGSRTPVHAADAPNTVGHPVPAGTVLRPMQGPSPRADRIEGKHSTPQRTENTQPPWPVSAVDLGPRPQAAGAEACRSG